jgi:two-component system sensor histidine kinase KdpD
MTELLNTIAHEFRTPLAVITGSSSMLQQHEERLDSDERREIYREIQQVGTRLGLLLDQVLELAELEAGAVRLDLGIVDLPQLVREAIAKAQLHVPDQLRERMTLHLHLRGAGGNAAQEVPLVRGDPRSIHTVLTHLLENAVRSLFHRGRAH